jgi:SAM-dependent methyltransferase
VTQSSGTSASTVAKKKKKRKSARNSDKHDLYQAAVQNVEVEVDFLDKTFRSLRGTTPQTLLEDFCGTALLCREWVQRGPKRKASGVDIDRRVLTWGLTEIHKELGPAAKRISLYERDVRERIPGRYDAAVALNFSYWVFKTRADMLGYFKNVHRHLNKKGVLFLDAYGGSEAWEQIEERRRVEGGFTYVWDQASFDPITHDIVNHIHFEFRDRSKMNFAFTYRWRFWTLPELRELLEEAGFSKVHVYWDHAESDKDPEDFRPTRHVKSQPGFITYLVALR